MTNYRAVVIGTIAMFSLTACLSPDRTRSSFGSGPVLSNQQTNSVSNSLGTVSMKSGTDDDGAAAYTDLNPSSAPVVTPSSGDATFFGTFEVVGITDISVSESAGLLFGTNYSDGGFVSLSADFGAGTLTGSSIGFSDGELNVNGTFTPGNSNLGGSVTYDGMGGSLDGVISDSSVLGGFHGNTDTDVFSGGFVADAGEG